MKKKYQLRFAAGLYWLLDMEQEILHYKPPLPINESGAFIWNEIQSGKKRNQILLSFCEKYAINDIEAAEDIEAFIQELIKRGFMNHGDIS